MHISIYTRISVYTPVAQYSRTLARATSVVPQRGLSGYTVLSSSKAEYILGHTTRSRYPWELGVFQKGGVADQFP